LTKIWEGKPTGAGMRFGIVMSRFNSTVTDKLLEGALLALARAEVAAEDVEVLRVPGAFEIPLAAKRLAETGRFAAVACLGAIIKGGTPHWDYLSRAVTDGIVRASLDTGVPMTNALLTTENLDQAVARAQGKGGDNKGYDAALAAVEVAVLHRRIASDGKGRS
jgi:6,7-dimethyl-8-ribityllumazine synthase